MKKRVLSLLVDNPSGVLSRVAGLFSRRGYSIDSITAGMTADPRFTRITVVSSGDELILSQIEKQIAKLEEEIERYQKLKLRLYEDLSDGVIDKAEYFEFRNSYTKIIEDKQEVLLRVRKEMKQTVTTGTTERNWVTLFKQYENIEELNRRVLMALVDRILMNNPAVTPWVALVVCCTLVGTVLCAKLVGCSLPILAEKIGFDPAVMASPFISTIVDSISLLIYFRFATLILGI